MDKDANLKQLYSDYHTQIEIIKKNEHDNKIEHFGIRSAEVMERHGDCCKLGKGANPKQQLIIDNWGNYQYRTYTMTGGNKFGKTTMGAVLAIALCIGYWPWDKDKTPISKPPVIVRWIGQDWEVHIKTVVQEALEMWWPKNFRVKTSKNNSAVKATWRCSNRSVLYLLSNEQDSGKHAGKDCDYVLFDEPPKRPIYIENVRGFAASTDEKPTTSGRTFISATLLKEAWIHRDIIKRLNPDGTPDKTVFNVHGDIQDNVGYGLSQRGVDEFARNLTTREKNIRLRGVPSYMEGLVYDFKREVHLKKRHKIPIRWPVDIAIDCHPKKEHAVLFMATDPRNYKYLCDEIFMHGDGTQLAEEIIRFINRNSYRVNVILIDHSAKGDENNIKSTYDKIDTVLARYGHGLVTYKKDETGGIRNTELLLKSDNDETVLWTFDDLRRTIWEFEGYMYDPETGKPIDKDNDMMDNLYALANEDTQYSSLTAGKKQGPPPNWRTA